MTQSLRIKDGKLCHSCQGATRRAMVTVFFHLWQGVTHHVSAGRCLRQVVAMCTTLTWYYTLYSIVYNRDTLSDYRKVLDVVQCSLITGFRFGHLCNSTRVATRRIYQGWTLYWTIGTVGVTVPPHITAFMPLESWGLYTNHNGLETVFLTQHIIPFRCIGRKPATLQP